MRKLRKPRIQDTAEVSCRREGQALMVLLVFIIIALFVINKTYYLSPISFGVFHGKRTLFNLDQEEAKALQPYYDTWESP